MSLLRALDKQPLVQKQTFEYDRWTKPQLINRIRELEGSPDTGGEIVENVTKEQKEEDNNTIKKKKKPREFDFSKYPKRFIALKFAYLGWNYNGLSFQQEVTSLPTVEEEILKALAKSRLIREPEPASCDLSRCGRTDKGVSAMNQVISLQVRSTLTEEELDDPANDHKELPYVTILNSLLPCDIRVTGVSLRPPPGFNARFSCTYRHYKYFFKNWGHLDIDKMRQAVCKYEGLHDFRNFCKLDGSKQINNYERNIYEAQINHWKDDFYVLDLKGTAFLWHQVRYMMAILFLVGQKLESPSIVADLLEPEKYPAKPQFEMASEVPLVLFDCGFEGLEWLTPLDFPNLHSKLIRDNTTVRALLLDYQLKAHVAGLMQEVAEHHLSHLALGSSESGIIEVGDGRGRNYKSYLSIDKRPVNDCFQIINERFRHKKRRCH